MGSCRGAYVSRVPWRSEPHSTFWGHFNEEFHCIHTHTHAVQLVTFLARQLLIEQRANPISFQYNAFFSFNISRACKRRCVIAKKNMLSARNTWLEHRIKHNTAALQDFFSHFPSLSAHSAGSLTLHVDMCQASVYEYVSLSLGQSAWLRLACQLDYRRKLECNYVCFCLFPTLFDCTQHAQRSSFVAFTFLRLNFFFLLLSTNGILSKFQRELI